MLKKHSRHSAAKGTAGPTLKTAAGPVGWQKRLQTKKDNSKKTATSNLFVLLSVFLVLDQRRF